MTIATNDDFKNLFLMPSIRINSAQPFKVLALFENQTENGVTIPFWSPNLNKATIQIIGIVGGGTASITAEQYNMNIPLSESSIINDDNYFPATTINQQLGDFLEVSTNKTGYSFDIQGFAIPLRFRISNATASTDITLNLIQ